MGNGASAEFIAEAQEIIDALNRDLIAAETEVRESSEVTPDRVNTLFRSAHSLKGLAGMFGLDAIGRLAHELESVLDGMRLGKVAIDAPALDVLFAAVEQFGVLIEQAEAGTDVAIDTLDPLVARLDAVATGAPQSDPSEPLALVDLSEDVLSVLTEYEEHRLRENIVKGRNLFVLRSSFDLTSFDVGLAEIDDAVKQIGEVITKLPSAAATEPGGISFDIIIGTTATRDELLAALSDERIEVVAIKRRGMVAGDEPSTGTELAPALPDAAEILGDDSSPELTTVRSVSRTVRVDIRRLDRLMNLVGELGLTRSAFARITDEMKQTHGFTGAAVDLHKEGRHFERRLAELQAGIMEVRMVPLANLFERMVRVGRKIARELGREVRIDTEGEHTELDKLIVEDLADPLMHLIRNAIDHGLEDPERRRATGKPAEGVVRLRASAQGNHVVVQVQDDGAGIDVDRALEKAILNQLIDAERATEMTRKDAFSLLFNPGFSTRSEVSQFSGRGVGLDVVRNNISQLSGVIDVDSEPGRGTTFTITLPITLAIIPALVVSVGQQIYAIPLNNVQETLALESEHIKTIERRRVISVRGTTVPLVDLCELFELGAVETNDSRFGVVAGVGDSRIALVVDDLVGQQDIVIKSLGRWMKNARGIAGATELGNQRTILVIDMVDILNEMADVEGGGVEVR